MVPATVPIAPSLKSPPRSSETVPLTIAPTVVFIAAFSPSDKPTYSAVAPGNAASPAKAAELMLFTIKSVTPLITGFVTTLKGFDIVPTASPTVRLAASAAPGAKAPALASKNANSPAPAPAPAPAPNDSRIVGPR